VPEKWARRLARGEPVARTLACSARDGRALACDWVLIPRQRKDGSVFRVTAVLRDQTPVVEKHDRGPRSRGTPLPRPLGLFRRALGLDLPGNRLHLSRAWRDLLGLPAVSSGTPADWLDRVHPEDAAPLRAALARTSCRTDSFEHEHRVHHADGRLALVLVRGTARRDEKGAAVRAAGLMATSRATAPWWSGWPTTPGTTADRPAQPHALLDLLATPSTGRAATRTTGSRCSSSTSTGSRW